MSLDDFTSFMTDVQRELDALSEPMTWAEQEIDAAAARHPCVADRIRSSFGLLRPTHPLLRNEMVYRSHCRELLDRVSTAEDTRPGTAAECCVALSEVSLRAPLRSSAAGLYARMWRLAALPPAPMTDGLEHYEAIHGAVIDDHEASLRRHLRQPWRVQPA